MESSNLKNMVILRNLPSNIIDEAIIVLKTNKKVKKLQKVEKVKNVNSKNKITNEKGYIIKEAEMIVNNYINKVENKKEKDFFQKKIKEKYKKLKSYSLAITILSILEAILIIF